MKSVRRTAWEYLDKIINIAGDAANTVEAANTDWFDESTRTGVVQNYNVSVSNGNERGSAFFSLGYYKNLGEKGFVEMDHLRLQDTLLKIKGIFYKHRSHHVQY